MTWVRGGWFGWVYYVVENCLRWFEPNLPAKAKGIVHFYNGRRTAEQWVKEGKYALNWTRGAFGNLRGLNHFDNHMEGVYHRFQVQ